MGPSKKTINISIYNTLCSNRVFDNLFQKYNVKSSNAAQTFFMLLADGLANNENVNVTVNSLLPINAKEQNKIFWKSQKDVENNIVFKTIPLVNLPLIRNIFVSIYLFFKVLFYRGSFRNHNYILVDFLRFSVNLPIVLAGKLRRIKIITVVTDMPGKSIKKQSLIGRIRNKLALLLKYDFYICVTKELNEVLNKSKKPSVIIESYANSNLIKIENKLENKFKERIIVYAGGLYERYGLKNLIEAFKKMNDSDLRLWFYGFGPFSENIEEYSKSDSRIQYMGILPNKELIEVLVKSTVLVNPRPTNEEYTKYSFPSKNLEYMSTGTPLLTTKLAGIPADHYPYIFTIEDDSVDGVLTSLTKVLKLNRTEIHAFGVNAKEFVMREKNNIKQAKKIVELLLNKSTVH